MLFNISRFLQEIIVDNPLWRRALGADPINAGKQRYATRMFLFPSALFISLSLLRINIFGESGEFSDDVLDAVNGPGFICAFSVSVMAILSRVEANPRSGNIEQYILAGISYRQILAACVPLISYGYLLTALFQIGILGMAYANYTLYIPYSASVVVGVSSIIAFLTSEIVDLGLRSAVPLAVRLVACIIIGFLPSPALWTLLHYNSVRILEANGNQLAIVECASWIARLWLASIVLRCGTGRMIALSS